MIFLADDLREQWQTKAGDWQMLAGMGRVRQEPDLEPGSDWRLQ